MILNIKIDYTGHRPTSEQKLEKKSLYSVKANLVLNNIFVYL